MVNLQTKQWMIIGLGIVGLVGIIIFSLAMNDTTPDSTVNEAPAPSAFVTITPGDDSTFEPATLQIATGTTVQWVNNDADEYLIASEPNANNGEPKDFNSGRNLKTGDTYTYTFTQPGTYTYRNHLVPEDGARGTVIVE